MKNEAFEILHSYNKKILFNYIRWNRNISRIELAQKSGLSATAVTRITNEFIKSGMVEEVGFCEVSTIGRKPIKLSICEDCMYAIGISIDSHSVSMGCVNLSGSVIAAIKDSGDQTLNPDLVVKTIRQMYDQLLTQLDDRIQDNIVGVGVSIPGLVSWPEGNTYLTPQLHWNPYPLREKISDALGTNVLVDNNVKSIALAEGLFNNSLMVQSQVVMDIGSGLGTAYIKDGCVFRGASGLFGETGHIIIDENGIECDCGRRGCLQTMICITGLEKQLHMPIQQILENQNDEQTKRVLDNAVHQLAKLVANIQNIYNPDEVILCGQLLKMWPELYERVRKESRRLAWMPAKDRIYIRKLTDTNDDFQIASAASILLNDILMPSAIIQESAVNQIQQRD